MPSKLTQVENTESLIRFPNSEHRKTNFLVSPDALCAAIRYIDPSREFSPKNTPEFLYEEFLYLYDINEEYTLKEFNQGYQSASNTSNIDTFISNIPQRSLLRIMVATDLIYQEMTTNSGNIGFAYDEVFNMVLNDVCIQTYNQIIKGQKYVDAYSTIFKHVIHSVKNEISKLTSLNIQIDEEIELTEDLKEEFNESRIVVERALESYLRSLNISNEFKERKRFIFWTLLNDEMKQTQLAEYFGVKETYIHANFHTTIRRVNSIIKASRHRVMKQQE